MQRVHSDIRRNDTVKVITGRDQGKQGRVLRVFPEEGKVLVEHVMMVKKARAPQPAAQRQGRHCRAGEPDFHLQRDADLRRLRSGAHPPRSAWRPQSSRLPQVRHDAGEMTRLARRSSLAAFILSEAARAESKDLQIEDLTNRYPLRNRERKVEEDMADEKQKKPQQAAGQERRGQGQGQSRPRPPSRPRATASRSAPKRAAVPRRVCATASRRKSRPALMKEFELKNPMAVPRINKVVVNMGVGEATQNAKVLDPAVAELQQITGQKPVITKAKKVHRRLQGARGQRPSASWSRCAATACTSFSTA